MTKIIFGFFNVLLLCRYKKYSECVINKTDVKDIALMFILTFCGTVVIYSAKFVQHLSLNLSKTAVFVSQTFESSVIFYSGMVKQKCYLKFCVSNKNSRAESVKRHKNGIKHSKKPVKKKYYCGVIHSVFPQERQSINKEQSFYEVFF